ETREMPVYSLEVAKGGAKLTPTKTEPAPAGNPAGPAQAHPTTMSVGGQGGWIRDYGKGNFARPVDPNAAAAAGGPQPHGGRSDGAEGPLRLLARLDASGICDGRCWVCDGRCRAVVLHGAQGGARAATGGDEGAG